MSLFDLVWRKICSHQSVNLKSSRYGSSIPRLRWWAPWLSVRVFSHFHTVSGRSCDYVTCHRHRTTYPDLCRSVAIISAHLQSFAMIFSDLWWFLPLANVSRSLQTPIWYHVALQKFYSSVKQLPRTPACRYIKIARLRQHTTLARHRHSNSEISQ